MKYLQKVLDDMNKNILIINDVIEENKQLFVNELDEYKAWINKAPSRNPMDL
jgi:hypothetical protein